MGGVVSKVTDVVGGVLGSVTGMKQPKAPAVQPGPAPAAEQKEIDQSAVRAREDRRRRAILAGGRSSTVKSVGGMQGLPSEQTTKKTILGA